MEMLHFGLRGKKTLMNNYPIDIKTAIFQTAPKPYPCSLFSITQA